MIVPAVVARRYSYQETYLEEVARRVKDILLRYTELRGFPFLGRLKEQESLTEKLESGRYQKWSQIDDLYACAIVMPTLQSEGAVLDFLNDRFDTVIVRKRGSSSKDPSVFRFDATRYVGRLRADERLPADSPLRGISFEVQLRSAFEHAWSAATHHLAYKPDQIDWRRLRIAAQLKASVEQLDQVIIGFVNAADLVTAHEWPEIEAKKGIEALFRAEFKSGRFPEELLPASWGRFCDNVYSILLASSETHVRNKEAFIRERLDLLRGAFASLDPKRVPRSVTITQLTLGLLAEQGLINRPLHRLVPLLTAELFSLYPETKHLQPGFDFEEDQLESRA